MWSVFLGPEHALTGQQQGNNAGEEGGDTEDIKSQEHPQKRRAQDGSPLDRRCCTAPDDGASIILAYRCDRRTFSARR